MRVYRFLGIVVACCILPGNFVRAEDTVTSLFLPPPTLHLQADSLNSLTPGSSVTTWTDASGNGHHAVDSNFGFLAASPPTYQTVGSTSVVRFNGSQFMEGPPLGTTGSSGYTAFIVARKTGPAGAGTAAIPFSVGGVAGAAAPTNREAVGFDLQDVSSNDPGFRFFGGNRLFDQTFSEGATAGDFQIASWTMTDGGTFDIDPRFFVDGIEATIETGNTNPTLSMNFVDGGFALGHGGGGTLGNPFSGDIAEILFYNRELTAEEFAQVGTYLESRFGLDTAFPDFVLAPEPGSVALFAILMCVGVAFHWRHRR